MLHNNVKIFMHYICLDKNANLIFIKKTERFVRSVFFFHNT